MSAEIRSPARSKTTSPTTNRDASISIGVPSRTTVARRGRRSRNFSLARSARYSCRNAKIPFMTITTKIAKPNCGIPATMAKPPATQSIKAKKWAICARSCRHAGIGFRIGRTLGPHSSNRRVASTVCSPCGFTFDLYIKEQRPFADKVTFRFRTERAVFDLLSKASRVCSDKSQ